jgi:hypothetical protein
LFKIGGKEHQHLIRKGENALLERPTFSFVGWIDHILFNEAVLASAAISA